jgi:hypothetical protein
MPCPGRLQWAAALALALAAAACDSKPAPPTSAGAAASPVSSGADASSAARRDLESLSFPAPKRLVAFGDVHGDLDATKRALKLAGAIDDAGAWAGGDLFVVQTGDGIDRGDQDREVLDLFDRLRDEAKAKGGTFLVLNGNHEIMNAQLDFRYVTPESAHSFDEFGKAQRPEVPPVGDAERGRANAFFPAGPYAKRLSEHPIVAIVGASVFVHGGLIQKHLDYGLVRMDGEVRAWLRGERALPKIAVAEDGPVWSRAYSAAPSTTECAELDKVLERLGAKRMVMGHTPQKPDISPACSEKAWRIDTGMSKHYGGNVEVLEIVGDVVRVLKE